MIFQPDPTGFSGLSGPSRRPPGSPISFFFFWGHRKRWSAGSCFQSSNRYMFGFLSILVRWTPAPKRSDHICVLNSDPNRTASWRGNRGTPSNCAHSFLLAVGLCLSQTSLRSHGAIYATAGSVRELPSGNQKRRGHCCSTRSLILGPCV